MGVMKRLSGIMQAKANKALDKAENPADMLDLSYEKQQENLTKVRRALADVTTAKKRLEMQAAQLQAQAQKLQDQAKQALGQGQEDLAREALTRRAALADQLTALGTQHQQVEAQQQQLESTAQRLQTQVEGFRTKKETLKATYAASQAQASIGEAVSGISESITDAGLTHRVELALDVVLAAAERVGERPAVEELVDGARAGLHLRDLVLRPLQGHPCVGDRLRDPRHGLADARLGLGGGIGRLEGLLLGAEPLDLCL